MRLIVLNLQDPPPAENILWDSERVQTAVTAFASAVGRETPPGFKYSSFAEMKELHSVCNYTHSSLLRQTSGYKLFMLASGH